MVDYLVHHIRCDVAAQLFSVQDDVYSGEQAAQIAAWAPEGSEGGRAPICAGGPGVTLTEWEPGNETPLHHRERFWL